MARKKLIAGNWKANRTPREAVTLINQLLPTIDREDVDVVICVPSIDIMPVLDALKGTKVMVGAENMHYKDEGAYTGETAPRMLQDAGCTHVIIGHSERRELFGETDEIVNLKLLKAYEYGLTPIVCCGETLAQRELGITRDWLRIQIKKAFAGTSAKTVQKTVIAYEPIWAIGTGRTASADQAEEGCRIIRKCIAEDFGQETADKVRILYGGSVNPANAAELFSMPDIDGGLVGGSSLKIDFADIVSYNG